jgi:RimJ/RimL family protein N-acetyltransferase
MGAIDPREPGDPAAPTAPGAPDATAPLQTARLLLRPWRDDAADLDAYAAISADPQVMRFIGDGRPLTRERSAQQLRGFVDHWRRHGFGLRAIVERDGGAVVGFAGVKRAGQPGVRPGDVEIGWRLVRDRWGRGYATEGALAVREQAFAQLRLARLVAFVRPGNAPSIHVMTKLGMRLEKEALCSYGLPMRIYALDNPLAAAATGARTQADAGTASPTAGPAG